YYQTVTSLVTSVPGVQGNAAWIRIVQGVLLMAFCFNYWTHRQALAGEPREALRAVWSVTTFYFLVVTPFLSPWYIIWPTVCASLLAERRTTFLSCLLGIGALGTYVTQFVLRPALGLGPVESNALGLLTISGPFLLGLGIEAVQKRSWASTRPQPALVE